MTASPDSQTPVKTTYSAEEIYQKLPHRYPFSLVDRIIDYVPGEKAVGLKNLTYNEEFFQGHIPGRPLMPGVLMVEAMAQVGGFILANMPGFEGQFFAFAGIDNVRFRRPVVPGDQLIMTVELLTIKRKSIAKVSALGEVDGKKVVSGDLMFSLLK